MRVNRYLFVLATLVVYTLLGLIPSFRIKLAPLAATTGVDDGSSYFLENFIHNWDFKLITAIVIATVVSMLANSKKIAKD